jgi:2'-5' RNA ligase
MMRLFIASPLSAELEEFLGKVILDLKQRRGRVKWVSPKNIHLTLKFLGETREDLIDPIKKAIERTSQNHNAVKTVINAVGAFPRPDRPRVIWAGLSENIEKLVLMASDIEDEMEKLGFPKEKRAFKSHLTLGRVKDDSGLGELSAAVKTYAIIPQEVIFDKIVLFKSTLTPQGPIYDRLFEIPLKK